MFKQNSSMVMLAVGGILWGMSIAAAADDKPAPGSDAGELVQAALQSEIDGAPDERRLLLEQALAADPEFAPARWHSGQVENDGSWERFVHEADEDDSTSTLAEYRRLRSGSKNSYEGHLNLANWCRRHDLSAQERAHLTAALERADNPNDPVLRNRLGFRLVDGEWLTLDEIETAERNAREMRQNFDLWLPKLQRIARGLQSPRPAVREKHAAQLKAIDDPAALPALEAVFSRMDLQTAHLLIEVMDNMQTHQAAAALARQAVLSPYQTVREAAAEKLRSRPPEEYAPGLLTRMHTPIQSKLDMYVGFREIQLTHAFMRESQDAIQVLEVNSKTRFVPSGSKSLRVGRPKDGLELTKNHSFNRRRIRDVLFEADLQAYSRNREAEVYNEETERMNERVAAALATATGVQSLEEPKEWWQWWLDYNQLYQDKEKPREYVYRTEEKKEPYGKVSVAPRSCLAAGTIVWTDRGPVPVEFVWVGDLVLSKNPETGELAYKPVIRTTTRPATPQFDVKIDGKSFAATGGHTFWVSGHGWMKIRDVQPGMRFHGTTGPAALEHMEEGPAEAAYNLVVADYHTYFVGESMILSHDTTFAQPTDRVVPGLAIADRAH